MVNIAQIPHLLIFVSLKLWFKFIYGHSKPEQCQNSVTKAPSTRMRIFLKTEVFFSVLALRPHVLENALQSEGFRKRCFRVYVWTGENEGFRKRRRDNRVQSIATRILSVVLCIFSRWQTKSLWLFYSG